jgi:hypothetical protein
MQKSVLQVSFDQTLELEDTPFYPQATYQCGPASLAMLLGASGIDTDPETLVSYIYLPGRRGSLQLEMLSASRRYGRIPYTIDSEISAIVSELRAGRPVLVLQNLGLNILPAYHYAVVIGTTPPNNIILRSGTTRRLVMEAAHFLAAWRRADSWGMIALSPGALPENPDANRFLDAVNSFETSGHAVSSEAAYRAAHSTWPQNQTALFALGNNLMLQGKDLEAVSVFNDLLAINPEHIAAANNLAEIFARQGCYPQALAKIERAVKNAEKTGSELTKIVLQTRQQIKQKMNRINPAECAIVSNTSD